MLGEEKTNLLLGLEVLGSFKMWIYFWVAWV